MLDTWKSEDLPTPVSTAREGRSVGQLSQKSSWRVSVGLVSQYHLRESSMGSAMLAEFVERMRKRGISPSES